MKDIERVSKIVEMVLEEDRDARNSDTLLYLEVCLKMNPIACQLPLEKAMRNRKELGLPDYESVRRSRQKLQHDREDLRACKDVTEERYEAFKEVLAYVQ